MHYEFYKPVAHKNVAPMNCIELEYNVDTQLAHRHREAWANEAEAEREREKKTKIIYHEIAYLVAANKNGF